MGKIHHTGNKLQVVYEDARLIVVDKPAGMLTMSTGKEGEITAYSILRSNMRIFIVHRLDRDTSGLLVFAKDEETKFALQENWSEVMLERKYVAILEGDIQDEEGWIESWIYENSKSMRVHCYDIRPGENPDRPPRKEWQFAATHCKRLEQLTIDSKPYTKVEFELETGRKNQIRVHSEWIGHPIAGDKKYGATTNPLGRLALHAQNLSFIHPWTGKTMKFTSQLPKEFRKLH